MITIFVSFLCVFLQNHFANVAYITLLVKKKNNNQTEFV